MLHLRRPRKRFPRISSKQVEGKKRAISVTAKPLVTPIPKDSPAKRCRLLEPWLSLANLVPATADHPARAEDAAVCALYRRALAAFPEPRLIPGAERLDPRMSQRAVWFLGYGFRERDALKLYTLAYAVRETFEAILRAERERTAGETRPAFSAAAHPAEFCIDAQGCVVHSEGDLFHGLFLKALEGLAAARIGRCEICASWFFAKRSDQRACSRRCGTALRVRAWRAREADYEQRRKFKRAGLKPPVKGATR